MHLVVGLNVNGSGSLRNLHVIQTACKGLLIDMGVKEHTVTQDIALIIHYPPVIRVVSTARAQRLAAREFALFCFFITMRDR